MLSVKGASSRANFNSLVGEIGVRREDGILPSGTDGVLMRATYVYSCICVCLCKLGNTVIMPGNRPKRYKAKWIKHHNKEKRLPENWLPAGLALGLAFMEKERVQQTAMYSNLVSGQRRMV